MDDPTYLDESLPQLYLQVLGNKSFIRMLDTVAPAPSPIQAWAPRATPPVLEVVETFKWTTSGANMFGPVCPPPPPASPTYEPSSPTYQPASPNHEPASVYHLPPGLLDDNVNGGKLNILLTMISSVSMLSYFQVNPRTRYSPGLQFPTIRMTLMNMDKSRTIHLPILNQVQVAIRRSSPQPLHKRLQV